MKNILKSWKTTLIGLVAIGGLGFNIYTNGGMSVTDFLLLITGVGFLLSKDSDKSHSVVMTVDPDKKEKPDGKG
jgi:hypothetical protein